MCDCWSLPKGLVGLLLAVGVGGRVMAVFRGLTFHFMEGLGGQFDIKPTLDGGDGEIGMYSTCYFSGNLLPFCSSRHLHTAAPQFNVLYLSRFYVSKARKDFKLSRYKSPFIKERHVTSALNRKKTERHLIINSTIFFFRRTYFIWWYNLLFSTLFLSPGDFFAATSQFSLYKKFKAGPGFCSAALLFNLWREMRRSIIVKCIFLPALL